MGAQPIPLIGIINFILIGVGLFYSRGQTVISKAIPQVCALAILTLVLMTFYAFGFNLILKYSIIRNISPP